MLYEEAPTTHTGRSLLGGADEVERDFSRLDLDIFNFRRNISEEIIMTLKEAIAHRIRQLCRERLITPYTLAISSGLDKSTIYSILGEKSQKPEVATIKKICDGLDITLGEFFSTPEFDALEQEIS